MAELAKLLEVFKDASSVLTFVVLIIPGFISLATYGLFVPGEQRKSVDSIIDILVYSFFNDVVCFAAGTLLLLKYSAPGPTAFIIFGLTALLATPVAWPIVYVFVIKNISKRMRIVNPIPKPWDHFFQKKPLVRVVIHLTDGRLVGGVYQEPGYTSSFPADEQIYLPEVWNLDERGAFVDEVKDTQGIIVSGKDIMALEFFKLPTDGDLTHEYDQNSVPQGVHGSGSAGGAVKPASLDDPGNGAQAEIAAYARLFKGMAGTLRDFWLR